MTENLDRHQRVRALFERLRVLPPATQADAVAAACAGDSALRKEVAGRRPPQTHKTDHSSNAAPLPRWATLPV